VLGKSQTQTYSASADAARRATRARDHLERKRAQERRRRERERSQSDRLGRPSPFRGAPSLVFFACALAAGIFSARPLNERISFQPTAFERVDVQGASVLSPEEIVRAAGLRERLAQGDFDVREIIRAIEAEPWIESARALRLPTGALMISVVERNAIAVWKTDEASDPLLVDRSGEPFNGALGPGGPLPLVSGGVDEHDASLPTEAIVILNALERSSSLAGNPRALTLYLPSAGVAESDDQTGYVLQLGSEGPRALLGRRLLDERVARLAALVESGEPTFLSARFIDLRYADRAVLRTEPASG
jgi:hypothetical protein